MGPDFDPRWKNWLDKPATPPAAHEGQGTGRRDTVIVPVKARLFCPYCHRQHVDEGEWAERLHHTHACQWCGKEWRVEPYCVGVITVHGFDEEPTNPDSTARLNMEAMTRLEKLETENAELRGERDNLRDDVIRLEEALRDAQATVTTLREAVDSSGEALQTFQAQLRAKLKALSEINEDLDTLDMDVSEAVADIEEVAETDPARAVS